MHISLLSLVGIQSVNSLLLRKRSQCSNIADLSLSTGKHGRAMNSRDQVNLSSQRSDLCDLTTIRTLVILEDHLADCLLLVLIYSFIQNLQPVFLLSECLS